MNKKFQCLILASLGGAIIAPAHAGLLTYQGITFNTAWSGNVLTLEIDAAGRKDAWAGATGLAALELDGIGNYSGMSVSAAPNGAAGWSTSGAELNAKGCSGATNGQAGSRICYFGQQIALADDMVFSFAFNGNAVRTVDPHLKLQFVDSKGKKVGGLMSQTLPATPGSGNNNADTPEIPPVDDQSHEPITPTAGGESASESSIGVPEPQGSALMLAGLGLMGLVARRKRRA
jgi:hypothetical protein